MARQLVVVLTLLLVLPVFAIGDESTSEVIKNKDQIDVTGLSSPRETMETFLDSMEAVVDGDIDSLSKAISTLNLEDINPLIRAEKGRDTVWILREVLKRSGWVDLKKFSSRKQGKPVTVRKYTNGVISIVSQNDGRWLFSNKTVRQLPSILDRLPKLENQESSSAPQVQLPWHLRFRAQLPDGLKQSWILLEYWQWIGIIAIIAIGFILDKLTALLLQTGVRLWRKRSKMAELWLLPDDWLRPLGLLLMSGVWWGGLNALGLPAQAFLILLVAVKLLAGISGVWACYRMVDFVAAYLQHYARSTQNKLDDVLVPLTRKTLKVFVTVAGVLFVASNLNLNLSGLIAGLGLGGLAFALAAKDMVQNLFGSVTVLLDQSFHVGDWVVIGDVEGTVEEVGLRSTRIRTFYNSEVILPNAKLITANIDNMGKRRFRRYKCKVSLTYDTPPEKVEAFCEAVREMVRIHPYMRKDYFHIYLNDLAASSLDILVYVFWETPDWSTELRERHRFLLDMLRIAQKMGVEFAFPTQTLQLRRDQPKLEDQDLVQFQSDSTEAMQQAREIAHSVIGETIDLNKKPPPVSFSQGV